MALRRPKQEPQEARVATADVPRGPGHGFYDKLNALVAEHRFDVRVEDSCRPYFADGIGRPAFRRACTSAC